MTGCADRYEEGFMEFLRAEIERQYAKHPTGCGGSFGEILCYEIHSADAPSGQGLTFVEIAAKWGISVSLLGELIADHCRRMEPVPRVNFTGQTAKAREREWKTTGEAMSDRCEFVPCWRHSLYRTEPAHTQSNEPDIKPAETKPDNGVVELLRALLIRAESGEVLALAGVAQLTGGEFAEFTSPSARKTPVIFLGYLRSLEMRLEKEIEVRDV